MEGLDRRKFAPPSGPEVFIDCRACWRHIKLDPTRVEIDNSQVVYRCQSCSNTFAIREDDAAALGIGTGS
jgi:DNA-directed RNA polymerase subunit RPC12/RpoP